MMRHIGSNSEHVHLLPNEELPIALRLFYRKLPGVPDIERRDYIVLVVPLKE